MDTYVYVSYDIKKKLNPKNESRTVLHHDI